MAADEPRAGTGEGGHGQIVAAVGEAGAGKSRLFYEFKATCRTDARCWKRTRSRTARRRRGCRCSNCCASYFGIADADDPATRREKVRAALDALDPALQDTLPYLLRLLGIVEGADPLPQMDPQIKRRRTLEAIKRIVLRESLKQPLVVIFEDLHWIDARDPGVARPARRQRRERARAAAGQLPSRVPARMGQQEPLPAAQARSAGRRERRSRC